MKRVTIQNPSDGGFLYWLVKLYLFALAAMASLLFFIGLGVYLHFCHELPPMPDLRRTPQPRPASRRYTARTARYWPSCRRSGARSSRFDHVPPSLIDAFLSTEDRRFFSHGGFDIRGLVRALRRQLCAPAA